MKIIYGYNEVGLNEAAMFIWENNTHARNWMPTPVDVIDLRNKILGDALRQLERNVHILLEERKTSSINTDWVNQIGTGGYYIGYCIDDENDQEIYISIDFLVDPAVSKRGHFVTKELKLDITDETL